MTNRILVLGLTVLAACTTRRVREQPILENGDRVLPVDVSAKAAQPQGASEVAELRAARDANTVEALSACAPLICEAIARGEVVRGMTELQLLAATRTTESAWIPRDAGDATIFVPAQLTSPPRDAVGELAMIRLRDGLVSSISYQEAQGIRLVDSPADATTAGRANALAEMLLREGDDLTARGDLKGALDRYDRAQVLRANDALTDYRIATVLDKQLRPIEALVRYQLFLHRLELEKIEARGDAYAKLAEAIAHARERIIVLEKRRHH
jgi:tetratricopeptide (TPR) repeat protein